MNFHGLPVGTVLMTTADGPVFTRCSLLLGILAWVLCGLVLVAGVSFLNNLTGLNLIRESGLGSAASLRLHATGLIQDHILTTFALAVIGFFILVLGGILAILGLITGRQAVALSGLSLPIVCGLVLSGTYLVSLGSLVVTACVA